MKKGIIILIIGILGIILIVIGITGKKKDGEPQGDAISTNGIHWHPQLRIYVDGNEIQIPENVGLVGQHSPVHTHEDLPIIHLEFEGLVTTEDITLGKFFKVWNKSSTDFGANVTMKVNGELKNALLLEDYIMQDGDVIELYYE